MNEVDPTVRLSVSLGDGCASPDVQLISGLADLMDWHMQQSGCTIKGRDAAVQWFCTRYSPSTQP